jgi:uncharacterized protein
MPLKLVLDTNAWLDWLVFDDPAMTPVSTAVAAGRGVIFSTAACEQELVRVLAYPLRNRVPLAAVLQAQFLARFRQAARMQQTSAIGSGAGDGAAALPLCRDPDDQKFLQLARDCCADFLLTRDRELLVLARKKYQPLPFRIITPAQFAAAMSC